jgi:hypothetical protein
MMRMIQSSQRPSAIPRRTGRLLAVCYTGRSVVDFSSAPFFELPMLLSYNPITMVLPTTIAHYGAVVVVVIIIIIFGGQHQQAAPPRGPPDGILNPTTTTDC